MRNFCHCKQNCIQALNSNSSVQQPGHPSVLSPQELKSKCIHLNYALGEFMGNSKVMDQLCQWEGPDGFVSILF